MSSRITTIKQALLAAFLLISSSFLFSKHTGVRPALAAPAATEREWVQDVNAGAGGMGTATLYDLDGDNFDEIIFGTTKEGYGTGALVVMEHTGDIKWQKDVPYSIESTPTIADISFPPDGIPEIVVSMGSTVDNPSGIPGAVVAYTRNGQKLWEYKTADAQNSGSPQGNFATPQVGDVDNDGDMEIVFGSWDRNIYMLDHNGNYVWHYHVADTVWSTGILFDLNGDGYLEYITGTDITGGGTLPDLYQPTDGGFILVLDKDGKLLARRQMSETIYSSIAMADADYDGDYEFFVGTGQSFYTQGKVSQPYVYGFEIDFTPETALGYGLIWEVDDLPGWPRSVAYPGMSSPGLANLDNDIDLEVFVGTGHDGGGEGCSDSPADPDCYGALYAWNVDGSAVSGFPMWPKESNGKSWFIRSSPTAADVDNDGQTEILLSIGWEIIVIGNNGVQEEAIHSDYSLFNAPVIGDPDHDGRTNLISIGSSLFNDGKKATVYNFELGDGSFNADKQEWPSFHYDSRNSGYVEAPRLDVSPDFIFAAVDTQVNEPDILVPLTITSAGAEATLDWSLSTPPNITADKTSGTVHNSAPETVYLTVPEALLQPGVNMLGSATVTTTSSRVAIKSVSVDIMIIDGEINTVYLPHIVQ